MWHSLKRWRDWAMTELRPLMRTGPQPQALTISYEKAGLTLHDAAIPWNADAVLVEASLKLPPSVRRKNDFALRLPGRDPLVPERMQPDESERYRVFFRVAPFDESTV